MSCRQLRAFVSEECGDVGKISQFEGPIHSSNVMLYSKENNIASRVTYQANEKGEKVRVFKKLLVTN